MEVNTQQLIQILSDKITLYQHLGIEVVSLNSEGVHFKIDLDKNKNHKGTAFGGSLYATAVLAAYALVFTAVKERGFETENIVIAKGEIQYLRPVMTDFEIHSAFPSPGIADDFFNELTSNKSARIRIQSDISAGGGSLKATFSGVFVVKL